MRKGKRDVWKGPYIQLGRDMLIKNEEWRNLSPKARDVYTQLKARYNGSNNGEIDLHYSQLKDIKGLKTNKSISEAFQELESKGWIKRTKIGGLHRWKNKYYLTGLHDKFLKDI